MVLGDAAAAVIHHAEIVLGVGQSLLGRTAVPLGRSDVIDSDAPAIFVHGAKIVLGNHVALHRSQSEPLDSLGFVLGHAFAGAIGLTQRELRLGLTLSGGQAI